MGEGRLLGIARRAAVRAPMETLDATFIGLATGVEGDHRGRVRPGKIPKRQVSILAREDWDAACAELGREIPWHLRRANLFIEGVRLPRWTGDTLCIGDHVRLRIMVETDPCFRMDEIAMGLQAALRPDWRGGICCRVLSEGPVAVGDRVWIEPAMITAQSVQAADAPLPSLRMAAN